MHRWLAVVALMAVGSVGVTWAQTTAPVSEPPAPSAEAPLVLTPDEITARLKEIEEAVGREPAAKAEVLELYRLAQSQLQAAANFAAKAASYEEAIVSAPAQIASLEAELQSVGEGPPVGSRRGRSDASLTQLEQQLAAQKAELATLRGKLDELESQLRTQQTRPAEARAQLAEAKQKRQELEPKLDGQLPADATPMLSEARRAAVQARLRARLAEINMLEAELLSHDVRVRMLTAQRHLVARQTAAVEARVKTLEDRVAARRRAEAERAKVEAERAKLEAIGKHPAKRELADRNAELARELEQVVAALEATAARRDALSKRVEEIQQYFQSAEQKLEIAGLSKALGQILRDQRRKLPELLPARGSQSKLEKTLSEVGLSQLRVAEERRELGDIDRAVARIMAESVAASTPAWQQPAIAAEIAKLLRDRQGLLDKLGATYASYLQTLGDVEFEQGQLRDNAERFATFLDKRLLWIPSTSHVGLGTVTDLRAALARSFVPQEWVESLRVALRRWEPRPALDLAAALLVAALLALRPRLRRTLRSLGESVRKPYKDRFDLTLGGLGLTVLLATPAPFALAYLGWRLGSGPQAVAWVDALSAALIAVALPLLLLDGLRVLCVRDGVAQAHFKWRATHVGPLRRHLAWLMALLLPAIFVTTLAEGQPESFRYSVGRLAFMVGLLAVAVFSWHVLHPSRGVAAEYMARNPKSWTARLRYIWYFAAVLLPLALAVLTGFGYHYTALQLFGRMTATLWLVVGAVIVRELVVRWVNVAQRRLALSEARKRRAALQEVRSAAQGAAEPHPAGEPEIPEIDLATMNEQTRHLLQTLIGWSVIVGLWLIWADVMPALGILDDVSLWEHTTMRDGQEVAEPFTLADFGLAVVAGLIIAVAARNLPGVLEIAVLRQLGIAPATRYAITTIAQYAIAAVGVVVVFSAIGVGWSDVQWLVAALSVGLGFGLQEIFGNFISGLIILFERPVRIGDTVTVGDLTGTVSRLRIRATTITDWDNKEIIVPNKTFITERLVNWTLTDSVTRVIVRVGVAYGSDTELAHRLMLEVARDNPHVLARPEPRVLFMGLGESALDFDVYVYVRELADRLPFIHEFHMAIERKLREHGIQIPFPQRDVHIRSGLADPWSGLWRASTRGAEGMAAE
ncbi:MAG: mechanosensitive ion channel [Gammaproteobacteria bacterium]|nr:mechanosensitive ion channel [Gammaproteobacteria bacterium]NIR85254.1 mechanosensitive ion channel [Gammaproteobacteria bacterium]NIR88373.1 mechanosensitive ion channel [Gammaproteobacteria bacterium]NIU06323.1 mechanosensitive ion channel [Gammaproteobacteria bacterium]NIV53222.1 mechanosensitive ion channel [Gammaproteobacteria bacterium]